MAVTETYRICHVASGDLWAGAEAQVASLLSELQRDASLQVSAVVMNRGTLYDRLISLGIETAVIDERTTSPIGIGRQLCALFRRWKPDVVHTHRYKENILGGLAAALGNVPVVVQTVHGMQEALRGWQGLKWKGYSLVAREMTRWTASGIIGVSSEIAALLEAQFPRIATTCIRNGVRESVRDEAGRSSIDRASIGVPQSGLVVGTVGRLTPIKGIEFFLDALAELSRSEEGAAVYGVVVGDGPLRAELARRAAELGIGERVRFLGERHDVPAVLSLLDVFVLPSLHEGIPLALLEAMMTGIPVVATAVGGVPEVVRHEIDGLLVPARQGRGLADAISGLRASRVLRERYGLAARERALAEFGVATMASKTKEFYRRLMSGRREKQRESSMFWGGRGPNSWTLSKFEEAD